MQSKLDRTNAIDSPHLDERPVSNNARENTIIDRILDDDGVNFANSIVEELWKDALAAGFDAEELKSIKVGRFYRSQSVHNFLRQLDLQHLETKIDKLRLFHKESLSEKVRDEAEPVAGEWQRRLKHVMHRVEKVYDSLREKIADASDSLHVEL